ncbi:hypothetical protein EKM01_03915 [Flavobacterium sp. RSP46]|uniref:hypothetical protein n=1 Tax=Flavobacterium sp. RSP46 TaxID=2497486 RepID=UPI000F86DCC1|nr:hypothetical protein [Flavobacterium sp. RSP46]RTY93256.1 hypothetical protein EKM01_03915 [Flavobacterium sp. RSP46]
MANLAQIYDWFMTGKKPTQAQFWASWGSFWNKEEPIPQSSISGLTSVLNAKTENDQFNAHKTDAVAHATLFSAKEDKTKKGVANGYAPLNEFAKIASDYLVIVNDLVTGGVTSLASAETVKTLKTQINAINVLLTSDNLNLDTVQELVDAIENVQTSLSTILVNDLTTGGTTKALTAEMGKTLKGLIDGLTTNKVDKVAGERLINEGEITKLAGLANITTTVKPILSTALATQNVAGFVTYINALNPVLVVGASEIVKYNLTDTGRVFELNLRNRSFGIGQPAIVAADVLEVTEFLNKDIKLSNYPNTRNDGQLPTNKVLSTDANGNLKMYTIATAPAPYLEVLIPDSTLPSTTTNFTLKGAFFTPTMTVAIVGQTINYITFVSDNLVKVNVTTGAAEGLYAVTLNNGLSATFANALMIVLGTVYTPTTEDWVNVTGFIDLTENSSAKVFSYGISGSATLKQPLFTIDVLNFRITFSFLQSPFGSETPEEWLSFLSLHRSSDNVKVYDFQILNAPWYGNTNTSYFRYYQNDNQAGVYIEDNIMQNAAVPINVLWTFQRLNGVITLRRGSTLVTTFSYNEATNMYAIFKVKRQDIMNIKYIELAS